MKNTASLLTVILLTSCAWWFTSCASEKVNSPLPPVTSLPSEPTSPSDTNEVALAGANAPVANFPVSSPATQSKTATSPYLAVPVVSTSAPMAVDVQPDSRWSNEGLLSLLFWLLAILLFAAAQRHKANYHWGNGMVSPQAGYAKIGLLAKNSSSASLSSEEPAASFGPPLLLDAKHPTPPIHSNHPPKEIIVTAFFNGQQHQMHFSPATTIKKVTAWAIYQFEISKEDHKDAYLAIRGYSAPLLETAHLGRFVMRDKTKIELDVKTITRVNV